MLELAYEHQDAGRPIFICTAAAQEMAELLAIVLTFDGAVGSVAEVIDGVYTGREGGPFNYREGKAQAIRELAAREDIDLAASYAYSDSESDLPMLRLVGHPVAVNPDKELARVAREEGWEIMRFERLGRKLRVAAAAARSARAAAAAGARDEPARADRRPAGDPRAGASASPTRRSRRTPPQWDREHHFPRELFAELGELGLMGVCVPEEHGGAGADFLAYVLVLEELSRADAGVGVTVAVHTSAGTLPILNHGSEEQIERFVPPLASGEELAAFALTESGSGSDAGAMRTRVERRPDHRRQAVDHQRLLRLARSSSSPRRASGRPRSSCAPAPRASASPARRRRWG